MPGPETSTTRRRGGLFAKYVLSLVGLVLFVLAAHGGLEVWTSYRESRAAVLEAMTEKAAATARQIEQAMTELERQISWVTRASVTSLDKRRDDYTQLMQQIPAITQLYLIDAASRERLRLTRAATPGSGGDLTKDPQFADAIQRGSAWGNSVVRDHRAFVTIAVAHSGPEPAVTVAEIDLRMLSRLLTEAVGGKPGRAYVIDKRGILLATSGDTGTIGDDLSALPQIAAELQKGRLTGAGRDQDGHAVLAVVQQVAPPNWSVVFEQLRSQALAPVQDLVIRTALLIAFGLAVAIIAGIILARRMLVPIEALHAGAERLGDGDFSQRIAVRTGDELEQLAQQFNSMAGQLQETCAGLENKVEARTKDLARSVAELKVLEEVGRAVVSSLDLAAVLPTIAARALEIAQADAVLIYGYDHARRRFDLAEVGGLAAPDRAAPYASIAADGSLLGYAALSGEPVAVADLAQAAETPLKALALAAGFAAVLVVPLADQQGTLGALVILRKSAGAFEDNLTGLMRTFAHQAALAMRNARLFHEVDHKGRELAEAHAIVQQQAEQLRAQTEQLKDWNRSLEARVATQLGEIERIRRLERFLAPQVAQLIAASDGKSSLLDSHRREVTVVFCDLRGFTAFTEASEPEEAMKVLREYHASLGELIFRYEGTLDRFAGDGVMVLFNAPILLPDHTSRAVQMAVEMRDALVALTENWRHRGHSLGFGIGIALGYATIGQVGFERRLEYAAIGSVTNLASRLCAEAAPGQIVVSQRAYAAIEASTEARPIPPLTLKGFSHPIPAMEILRWRQTDDATAAANAAKASRAV